MLCDFAGQKNLAVNRHKQRKTVLGLLVISIVSTVLVFTLLSIFSHGQSNSEKALTTIIASDNAHKTTSQTVVLQEDSQSNNLPKYSFHCLLREGCSQAQLIVSTN